MRRHALDRAIEICDQPAARLARAELARHAGRAADARADLAALAEPWPVALAARASRLAALLALDAGEALEAARLLDQAVARAVDDRERARSLAVRFAHRLVLAEPPGDGDGDGIAAYDGFRTSGDASGAASVLANLGLAALHRGEDERARDRLRRAEQEARAGGDRPGLAGARLFLGLGDLAAGPLDRAIAALAEAEEMALDLARFGIWSDAVGYGAIARLIAGQPAARAALASHSDELARRGPPHARAFFAAVLHLVDDLRPPPDPDLARGRPLLAAAIAALAAPPPAPYGLPVRIALRVRGALAPRPAPATPTLAVSSDRRRFSLGGAEVDLTRRGPLGRVFAALVARAGADAAADELIAAGWPGESIRPEAARLRLYNAIAALRAMGLRGVLLTTDAGYRLEARFQDLSAR